MMHQSSPAPFVDMRLGDGESIALGKLRLQVMHTPGHTRDSMCLRVENRLFTGDTLLIGATGRTDLPTGDPEAQHDSLFNRLLRLDPALEVHPAHEYEDWDHTTCRADSSSCASMTSYRIRLFVFSRCVNSGASRPWRRRLCGRSDSSGRSLSMAE
ncbi:MAG TPA: MBL fold metallo-hydrolase [Steroidobacteraceae bacterium]